MKDLFVIGGGVNGCGIARDASGRGLSVTLAEMGDLAQATSSSSSKLFHGGLRYLEYYKFRLVREALRERETLLCAMPHISRPMRFVLPYHNGLRASWLLRLGLFMYDHLGGRKILPATRVVNFETDVVGRPLRDIFRRGFEYSDCWVDDARLVVLNAMDAKLRGATVLTRTKVVGAERHADHWEITTEDAFSGERETHLARSVVNAAGPWVADVLTGELAQSSREAIRLVRGSHIVVPKIFDHEKPYILQGKDGRIVFAIPYEQDFTLIGTTDVDHNSDPAEPACTTDEIAYLCGFVSEYFEVPVAPEDVVWTYSGVRPLYDDGADDAKAATRDYVLSLNTDAAPVLSVFGGKITTYRRLSEEVLAKLGHRKPWTARVALPGGDFAWDGVGNLIEKLRQKYVFLDHQWAHRLVLLYGTRAFDVLGDATSPEDLGTQFGCGLSAAELIYLHDHEFAKTGEDVLWRRSKLGLKMDQAARDAVSEFMREIEG